MPVQSTPVGSKIPAVDETPVDRRERLRLSAEDALRQSVLPRPISRDRFLLLLRAGDPSLGASPALLEAHSSYLAGVERSNESATRQILRLLPAAYTFDPARETFDPRPTPELVALLALRDKSIRTIRTAERQLLDAVESQVPASSRTAWARAVLAWRLEELPRDALLPSTRTSLLEILPRVRVEEASLAALDPFVGEYARTLAAALQDRTRLLADADTARAITETSAGTLWRYAPAEVSAAVERKLAELDAGEFASELGIRTIHFDALARMRARLQPRDGRLLVELWQRTLHPSLFEDERILSRMVEETLAHPGFSRDQSTALLDALETVYQRLEPLSRKACEAADRVLPSLAERSERSMAEEIDARLELIEVQQKRRGIVREALLRIRGMFGDADAAQSARIEDALASLDSLVRADAFDRKSLTARRGSSAAPASEPPPGAAPQMSEPAPAAAPERPAVQDAASDRGEPGESRPSGGRSGRSGRGPRRSVGGG